MCFSTEIDANVDDVEILFVISDGGEGVCGGWGGLNISGPQIQSQRPPREVLTLEGAVFRLKSKNCFPPRPIRGKIWIFVQEISLVS